MFLQSMIKETAGRHFAADWVYGNSLPFEKLPKSVVLNLFGTVAHFVFFESLHGPLLCGPPLLDYSSVALRLEEKVSTFESAMFAHWLP